MIYYRPPPPEPTQGGGQLINTHTCGKNYYSDEENLAMTLLKTVVDSHLIEKTVKHRNWVIKTGVGGRNKVWN